MSQSLSFREFAVIITFKVYVFYNYSVLMNRVRKAIGIVQKVYKRNRHDQHVLVSVPFSTIHSDLPTSDAIRWIDSITIADVPLMVLFQHPNSTIEYSMTVGRGSYFEASYALQEEVWNQNTDGVLFTVRIIDKEGIAHETVELSQPSENEDDKKWKKITVPLQAYVGQKIQLQLETSIPNNGSPAHAWAVWGTPHVYQVVPWLTAIRNMVKKASAIMKAQGIKGLVQGAARVEQGDTYAAWVTAHSLGIEEVKRIKNEVDHFAYKPLVSIITPVYNADPIWLDRCIESVQEQYYENWEMCLVDDGSTKKETKDALRKYCNTDKRLKIQFNEKNGGISAASNDALALASGEYISLMDNDDEIVPEALYEVVKVLNENRDIDMIYSDEDKLEVDGTPVEPFFKPDWSPEYFLSSMYTSHLGTYRKSIIDEIGGFRSEYDKAQDYDLVLRFIEKTEASKIEHIPKILYHWRKIPGSTATSIGEKDLSDAPATRALEDYVKRNNLNAEVVLDPETTYHRIKYKIEGEPLVSIELPTNGSIVEHEDGTKSNLLLNCLESVLTKTTYKNYEIIIGHNNNLTPETAKQIEKYAAEQPDRFTITEYTYEEPFNFAHKINTIAKHAKGDYMLLLNDDIEVISPEWMTALLEYAQLPEIGVVGAKLFFPDKKLQHVGVIMGIGGGASHAFLGAPENEPGYFASTKVIKNYSVVTGACYMTRMSLFRELKGLDEEFRIDYNDVDYCLRAREKGYRVVYTPYAQLTHHESVSLGTRAGQTDRPEERLLRDRWKDVIEHDPYYNPNLTLTELHYQIKL